MIPNARLSIASGSGCCSDSAPGLSDSGVKTRRSRVSHSARMGGAFVTAGKTARVWETETGSPVTPRMQYLGTARNAAFSPDGRSLLIASGLEFPNTPKDEVRVWDSATGIAQICADRF